MRSEGRRLGGGGGREQGCDLNFPYVGEQILNAGNNACAPLKLEDPVVRLIGDGGERGKRFLIRTSRTLLLPAYSPFLRGCYYLFALFLWQP